MKKYIVRLGIAVVIVVGIIFAYPASRVRMIGYLRGEPFFEGRPASYWHDALLEPTSRAEAFDELTEGGSAAVPVLLRLEIQHGSEFPFPGLILRNMGEAAMPGLLAALKDDDKQVRRSAARQLRRFEKTAPATFPGLIAALQDRDELVRREAVQTLGIFCCHEEANALAPALTDALADESFAVRGPAACALAFLNPPREAGAAVLAEVLQQGDAGQRRLAASAMGRIRQRASVPFLEGACTDEDPAVRREAAIALGKIGPDAKAVVPVLLTSLQDQDAGLRSAVAWAVGKIAPEALIVGMQDENPAVRATVAQTLGTIQPPLQAAVPALLRALDDPDANVRLAAGTALKKLDPEAMAKAKKR